MQRRQVTDFNINTSKMKNYLGVFRRYYAELSGRTVMKLFLDAPGDPELTVDPFARNCEWAHPHTNDINPRTSAVHHQDALDFLESYLPSTFKIGLLDPPFSDRMAKDKYGTSNLYASDSKKMRKIELQLGNIIETGGVLIKLGYNTSRPHPSFVLEDLEVWNLGACRNDILCSIWRKMNTAIEEWT